MTDFDQFWLAYPKRVAKLDALKAWNKMKPPLQEVLTALVWQCKEWTDPKFIPYPATYLRAGQWMDERPYTKPPAFKFPERIVTAPGPIPKEALTPTDPQAVQRIMDRLAKVKAE